METGLVLRGCTEPYNLTPARTGCKWARKFVDLWIRSRLRRLNPASSLGGQLEHLRRLAETSLGMQVQLCNSWFVIPCKDDSGIYAAAYRADQRMANESWMDGIMLSPDFPVVDRLIVELKHTAVCFEIVEKCKPLSDYHEGDGSSLKTVCKDELDGLGIFETPEPVYFSNELIAEALFVGMVDMTGRRWPPMTGKDRRMLTVSQIRYRTSRAYRFINEELAKRTDLMPTEGSHA